MKGKNLKKIYKAKASSNVVSVIVMVISIIGTTLIASTAEVRTFMAGTFAAKTKEACVKAEAKIPDCGSKKIATWYEGQCKYKCVSPEKNQAMVGTSSNPTENLKRCANGWKLCNCSNKPSEDMATITGKCDGNIQVIGVSSGGKEVEVKNLVNNMTGRVSASEASIKSYLTEGQKAQLVESTTPSPTGTPVATSVVITVSKGREVDPTDTDGGATPSVPVSDTMPLTTASSGVGTPAVVEPLEAIDDWWLNDPALNDIRMAECSMLSGMQFFIANMYGGAVSYRYEIGEDGKIYDTGKTGADYVQERCSEFDK